MSESGKVIKSVGFNVKNAKDLVMLKYVKRRNFSGYVKKLIMADIEARKSVDTDEVKIIIPSKKQSRF